MAADNTSMLGGVFEWVFAVVDKASPALSAIKNAFKTVGGVVKAAAKAFSGAMNEITSNLVSFGSSVWTNITNIVPKALSAVSDLTDIYLGLGINVQKGTKEMKNAFKVMSMLEWQLGLTSDEAKELVNQGQGLGILGKDLQNWARYSAEYAKATGQSASAVGELFYQMHRLYGMGTQQLRGIGAAMKYVGDKTAISHDELVSFVKGLDAFYVRLPKQSQATRGRITTDLVAIAGAMKDNLGDPQKLAGVFEKIADPMSPEGRQMASVMGMIGGMMSEEVTKGIQTNPGDVIARFAGGLAKMSRKELEMQAPFLSSVFGFTFQDLRAFQDMAEKATKQGKSIQQFIADTRKEYEKESRARKKAAEVTNWYRKQQEAFRRAMLRLWATVGKPLMRFVKGFMQPFIEALNKIASTMTGSVGRQTLQRFEDLGKTVGKFVGEKLMALGDWVAKHWDDILKFFASVGDKAFKIFQALWQIADKIPWKVLGDNIHWIAAGLAGWKIGGGLVGTIIAATAAIYKMVEAGLEAKRLQEEARMQWIKGRDVSTTLLTEQMFAARSESAKAKAREAFMKRERAFFEKQIQPMLLREFGPLEGMKKIEEQRKGMEEWFTTAIHRAEIRAQEKEVKLMRLSKMTRSEQEAVIRQEGKGTFGKLAAERGYGQKGGALRALREMEERKLRRPIPVTAGIPPTPVGRGETIKSINENLLNINSNLERGNRERQEGNKERKNQTRAVRKSREDALALGNVLEFE